jgi:hypothetical protein
LKKNALSILAVVTLAACPAMAHPHHSSVDCAKVRAYVAQVGLQQARAVALAAGMTASQEREAARCLERKI